MTVHQKESAAVFKSQAVCGRKGRFLQRRLSIAQIEPAIQTPTLGHR